MIKLITAVPGSGKTLLAIKIILAELEKGRPVYARIDGLNIPAVKPAPDDWRDTPEGSLVIYDEAQEIFPSNAKPGAVTDERLTSMEVHRHTGHDLIFITQAPTFIHHHIRKLVGEHQHLYRPNGIQGTNIYTWGFAVLDPNDRREQERADHELWKFDKKLYPLYKSATIHTHKFKIPKKIAIVLTLIILGFCYVAYALSDGLSTTRAIAESANKQAEGEGALAAPPPAVTLFYFSMDPYPSCCACLRLC